MYTTSDQCLIPGTEFEELYSGTNITVYCEVKCYNGTPYSMDPKYDVHAYSYTPNPENVTGWSNSLYPIVVNGTTFYVYESNYPLSYEWITVKDTCQPSDPKSCAYLTDKHCCGYWRIDGWY